MLKVSKTRPEVGHTWPSYLWIQIDG
jgi:hypothetical protein